MFLSAYGPYKEEQHKEADDQRDNGPGGSGPFLKGQDVIMI